jgi:transglutaminase-like putative cysteine protease
MLRRLLHPFRPKPKAAPTAPASPAINQGQTLWLALAALGALLPLAPNLPTWLGPLSGLFILWRGWMLWRRFPLPPGWLINLAALLGAIGIGLHFRTIFGKDPGVALLSLFLALKLFETRNRRDAFVVALLSLFLILSQFFYNQTMGTALVMGAATLLVTATLVALQRAVAPPRQTLRTAAILLAQALPFMVLLFVLFPRVSGPLWGLPADANSGRSGLGESMSPGTISQLSLSEAIAFRVRFKDKQPPQDRLYWRGPVLTDFDGLTWRTPALNSRPEFPPRPNYTPTGKRVDYEMTLEPHGQLWLLALDFPGSALPETRLTSTYQLLADKPVRTRLRLDLRAYPDTRPGADETVPRLRQALQLPKDGNPKTRALAEELRQHYRKDGDLVEAFLQRIRSEQFVYTLTPPLLGKDTVDDFLFTTRRGFCEHYASALVFVLRAAGIPARVVTGYQGGEINPVDGYLLVRQSDAHAWAEVWLAGEGWRRVDPTAAVAPNRVENNLAAAVPSTDPLPLLTRPELEWLRQARYRWEAVNNAWNQWVLGYDAQKQQGLLQKLGITAPDWKTLVSLMAGLVGVLLLTMSFWVMAQRIARDPLTDLWRRFDRKLTRHGLGRQPWEGPAHYRHRLQAELPDQEEEIRGICTLYEALRYGRVGPEYSDSLHRLARAIARFEPTIASQRPR